MLSQNRLGGRCSVVNAEAVSEAEGGADRREIEEVFRAHYPRVSRLVARVTRDPARAEELAVEVFLKLWRSPAMPDDNLEGWLHRTAVRTGLDELRRRTRRSHYERLLGVFGLAPTPEETCTAAEGREQVQRVLAALDPRKAELLILRSHGLTYAELAAALDLNPASVGTLLGRAQQAFRKEYIGRYGTKE